MRLKSAVVALAVLAALMAIIPNAALAAHPSAKPNAPASSEVFGTLTSLTSTEAVIMTRTEPVSVVLLPTTAYVSYDYAAATAGLKVGDNVEATGTFHDGILHADRLRYDTVPFIVSKLTTFDGLYVTPSSTGSTTITLQLRPGVLITFNTDANTRYYQDGRRLTGPPTFTADERVIVGAYQFSDQSWLARTVDVITVSKLTRFDGHYVATAMASTLITLRLRPGVVVTFNTDASTRYYRNGNLLPGRPNFFAGEHLVIRAYAFPNKLWLARTVNALIPIKVG